MVKKKKNQTEVSEEDVNRDDLPEEGFVPEQVDDGVVRDEQKENPMDLVNQTVRKRIKGNWKKVSKEEMARLEQAGILRGYDPETGEVLTK